LQIVELLDNYLASSSHELSETLVKKYSFAFYSKASTHILQFYLEGHRFDRQSLPAIPPVTPYHSGRDVYANMSLSSVSTPMSTSTSSSEDDMPITPMATPGDPFAGAINSVDDKENILPLSMQMHGYQHHSPVKHIVDDSNNATGQPITAFGRSKLTEINRALRSSPNSMHV